MEIWLCAHPASIRLNAFSFIYRWFTSMFYLCTRRFRDEGEFGQPYLWLVRSYTIFFLLFSNSYSWNGISNLFCVTVSRITNMCCLVYFHHFKYSIYPIKYSFLEFFRQTLQFCILLNVMKFVFASMQIIKTITATSREKVTLSSSVRLY